MYYTGTCRHQHDGISCCPSQGGSGHAVTNAVHDYKVHFILDMFHGVFIYETHDCNADLSVYINATYFVAM